MLFHPQVMIYQLADLVQGFLSEHNKPPSRSFHEEMLKNQRRQQEKRAQEEQQRMDQQRKRAEETVRREQRSLDLISQTDDEVAFISSHLTFNICKIIAGS